jgi:RNA-directed DNA polymerase
LLIASASIAKLKDKIREITRRNRGVSFEQVIKEINKILPGWMRYFHLAEAEDILDRIDGWIRRKLRCLRLKQLKNNKTIAKFLIKRAIAPGSSWKVATSGKGWWRLSNTPQLTRAMGVGWFEMSGLVSMVSVYRKILYA